MEFIHVMLFNSVADVMSGDKIIRFMSMLTVFWYFFFLPRFIAESSWISPKQKLLSCDETCVSIVCASR